MQRHDPCITITCAICARSVDRIEWFDDLISMNRVIIAHCHGSKDEMRLSDRQLLALDKAARRGTILSAVAFSDPEKHPIPYPGHDSGDCQGGDRGTNGERGWVLHRH